jgi:hypothetical protein
MSIMVRTVVRAGIEDLRQADLRQADLRQADLRQAESLRSPA